MKKKYIDAEKLIHDLEERISAYSKGYSEGDDCRKDAIETLLKDIRHQCSLQLEKPDVDLEKASEEFARCYDQDTCDGIAQDCFIAGAQWQKKQTLQKAEKWLRDHIDIPSAISVDENGELLADSYIAHAKERLETANKIIDDFKKAMDDEK